MADLVFGTMIQIRRYRQINAALVRFNQSLHHSGIGFVDTASLKLATDMGQRLFAERHHHNAGCIKIQTVNYGGLRVIRLQTSNDRIPIARMPPGHAQEPTGFVDQQKAGILVQNFQRLVAGRENKKLVDGVAHGLSEVWDRLG